MPFTPPAEVRRSFAKGSGMVVDGVGHPVAGRRGQTQRIQRANSWTGKRLNYAFMERCKELVLRVKHPNAYMGHRKTEIRVSIMPWGRGSYLDIRKYFNGRPSADGILLHLDIADAILSDLVGAVRRMALEDTREPEQKSKIEVIRA